jgi:hypothetical protein
MRTPALSEIEEATRAAAVATLLARNLALRLAGSRYVNQGEATVLVLLLPMLGGADGMAQAALGLFDAKKGREEG